MKGNPLLGWGYVLQGVKNLGQPGLRRFVALPLLINALLLSALSYSGIRWLNSAIESVVSYLPSWLEWLYWIVMPLAAMTLLLIFAYFFSAILITIASPFNGMLSEKVERQRGVQIADESVARVVKRTFAREWTKLKYILPRYLGLLILSFIPGLNLVSPFLWFWFGSWIVALQYIDYSFDNHARSFTEMRAELATQPLTVLGFGATVALLMMIPVLNWFVMPAAVIGATLLRMEQMPLNGPIVDKSGKNDSVNYADSNTDPLRLTDGKTENSGRG